MFECKIHHFQRHSCALSPVISHLSADDLKLKPVCARHSRAISGAKQSQNSRKKRRKTVAQQAQNSREQLSSGVADVIVPLMTRICESVTVTMLADRGWSFTYKSHHFQYKSHHFQYESHHFQYKTHHFQYKTHHF